MEAIQVREGIYWVGGIDWDLRDFHGYKVPRGTTYNAYLVMDEKITLLDTVKYYMVPEMMDRISSIVDPAKIDCVISNHVEMDHSGGLPGLMKLLPGAALYTTPQGQRGLKAHYPGDWNYQVVKSGDSLDLGKRSIHFVQTPMVHWPDNMVSYMPEEKILFSNDAFGQHIASFQRFDDQLPLEVILEQAQSYYANIVMPFGSQVTKALKAASGLEIEVIAPSHGIIWRSHLPAILEKYQQWAGYQVEERAVIVYDTMWGSTRLIAGALQDAFEGEGIPVTLKSLKSNHISEVMPDILTARYVCVGSPTLNNNLFPTVASFLTYLKGLAPKNKVGLAFGSYGWSGQSVGQVEEVLQEAGFEIMDMVRIPYIPDRATLEGIKEQVKGSLGQLQGK